MPEELQSLLDRIQKDGVLKAQAETDRILAEARRQADQIVRDAEKQAQDIRKNAERDSEVLVQRGRKALEQAARDTILSVGEATQNLFRGFVARDVEKALSPDVLKKMLIAVVQSYCTGEDACSRIDLLVNPAQQKQIVDFFMSEFREALHKGIEIHATPHLAAGFRVSIESDNVHHDFSPEAIVEALCHFLRPQIADIVRRAVAGMNVRADRSP